MNKDEFLKQLNNCLSALSPDERKDAIRYYIEYFDEAGKENETRILLELGSPEETAKAILADYGYDTELPKSNGKKAQENVKEFVSACINDPDVKNIAKKSGDNIVGFSKKVFSFVSKAFKWCLKTFLKFAAVFSVLFLAFFVFGTIAFVFAIGIASVLCAVVLLICSLFIVFEDLATGCVGMGGAFVLSSLGILITICGYKVLEKASVLFKKIYVEFKEKLFVRKENKNEEN